MKHTISALVKNRPGVLSEMAQEFTRHHLNISSISCGETENPEISRMVICVEAENGKVGEITSTVESMDFVIQVDDLSRREFVDRELVMVKVAMDKDTTSQIMQVVEVFRANVVGMGQSTMTVELAGNEDRITGFIKMLSPYGIKSMCRTGKIALKRGDD